jgi:predicted nucleic acid-binding protein
VIYIDTGAFLARYMNRDQYHQRAIAGWRRLGESGQRCFTSNLVLSETLTLLARRAGYPFAAQRARHIFSSEILTILRSSNEDEYEALELFEKFADQKVSFTDCISFVLIRQKNLKDVFSFDSHFERAGFRLWE